METHNVLGHIQAFCKLIHLNITSIISGIISLVLISATTILKVINEPNTILIVITITSTSVTIISLSFNMIKEILIQNRMIIHHLTSDELDFLYDDLTKKSGYELIKSNNERLMYRKTDNEYIKSNIDQLNFTIKNHPKYSIPKEFSRNAYRIFHDYFKTKKHLFDDEKIRMNIGLEELQQEKKENQIIQLSKTSYFNSLCTNEIASLEFRHDNEVSYCLDGYSLVISKGNSNKLSRIYTLSESQCSNHIGISTLAITTDNFAILSIQGKKNLNNSNKYNVSGSGSLDYTDLEDCNNFAELIIKGMHRELCEECDIPDSRIIDTRIIGYGRLLHRGGKPEFFGITKVNMTSKEIISYGNAGPEAEKQYVEKLEKVPFNENKELFRKIILESHKAEQLTVQLKYYIDELLN